jgi:surfactin synthase thioesterase subunit
VREPVEFQAGMEALRQAGVDAFLEVGPSPVLVGLGKACLPDLPALWLHSLRRGKEDWEQVLQSLGRLYVSGAAVDWSGWDRPFSRRRVSLPSYPFQRSRHWVLPRAGQGRPERRRATDFLQPRRIPSPLREALYACELHPDDSPLLRDHRVQGVNVVSGVIHMAVVSTAVRALLRSEAPLEFEDVSFVHPLVLGQEEARRVQLILSPGEDGAVAFRFFSQEDANAEEWQLHTQGRVRREGEAEVSREAPEPVEALQARCSALWSGEAFYRELWSSEGHVIGPSYQFVERVWLGEGEALGLLRGPMARGEAEEAALTEACGQLFKAALPERARGESFMAVGAERLRYRVRSVHGVRWCHVCLTERQEEGFAGELRLLGEQGEVLAEAQGFRFRKVAPGFIRHVLQGQVAGGEAKRWGHSREEILAAAPAERRRLLEEGLRREAAAILGVTEEELAAGGSLRELGMDSLMAGELKTGLLRHLGVDLPMAELLAGPTLPQLVGKVAEALGAVEPREGFVAGKPAEAEVRAGAWASPLRRKAEARLRLFCLPHGGAGASLFRRWEQGPLPEGIELWPIQLPGREERIHEAPFTRLEPLLDRLSEALVPLLDRPFALFGNSMGALVGFELARRLRREHGLSPEHLVVAAYPAPHLPNVLANRLAALDTGDQALLDEAGAARLEALLPEPLRHDAGLRAAILPTLRADLRLVRGYSYQPEEPLDCSITAVGGAQDEDIQPEALAEWRIHTRGQFRVHVLPGGHLFLESHRDHLLELLTRELQSHLKG